MIGTTISNVALVIAEGILLRRALGGFETRPTLLAIAQILVGAAALAVVAYGVWWGLDDLLGRLADRPDQSRVGTGSGGRQRGLRGGRSRPPDS